MPGPDQQAVTSNIKTVASTGKILRGLYENLMKLPQKTNNTLLTNGIKLDIKTADIRNQVHSTGEKLNGSEQISMAIKANIDELKNLKTTVGLANTLAEQINPISTKIAGQRQLREAFAEEIRQLIVKQLNDIPALFEKFQRGNLSKENIKTKLNEYMKMCDAVVIKVAPFITSQELLQTDLGVLIKQVNQAIGQVKESGMTTVSPLNPTQSK